MVVDEVCANVVFEGGEEDVPKAVFTDRARGARWFVGEYFFSFCFEVLPACFLDISIGAVWVCRGFRKPICQCNEDWQII